LKRLPDIAPAAGKRPESSAACGIWNWMRKSISPISTTWTRARVLRIRMSGVYRYIDIDFEDDDFVFDGSMDGIQIGLMMTF
jgi:hypothetical protein